MLADVRAKCISARSYASVVILARGYKISKAITQIFVFMIGEISKDFSRVVEEVG